MERRAQFPGGLRAQLLLGLCLMLLGTFALILVTVENLVARQLRDAAVTETRAIATVSARAIEQGVSAEELLGGRIIAVLDADGTCAGKRCDELQSASDAAIVDSGADWFGVADVDQRRFLVSLPSFERRRAQARGFLWPFFLIDAIFVLALAYGFFTFIILRPLRAIGVAAVRASEGDFASPISHVPRNEFGEVGRSFNEMLRRIDEGRAALEAKIAEVQKANERIAKTQASLVRSEKLASVGHLAAGVAHEVGNPLAAVSGYIELLDDDSLSDDEQRDILERCTRELERIRTIIRNLLDYSRADESVERVPAELGPIVRDAVALVEAIPRARDKAFVVHGDARAFTFPAHVVQVLVNLLVNAVDAYGPGEGQIEISLAESGGMASIIVADKGDGIGPDKLEQIFEPFFTTKDPGQGTGLGLSICLRVVEDLGGTLTVDSELGEGSTFTIQLPMKEATDG